MNVNQAVPLIAPVPPIVNAQPNNNAAINHVRIRVPPFWKQDPQLWFLQLEAQFANSNIVTDLTKFNTIVGNVESDILSSVSDIIRNPPAINCYETIKTRLIAQFQISDNSKLKNLLHNLTLGDLRPSDLLRKMRDLSCGKVGDDLLKTLWLQRLPNNIQSVLACSADALPALATMADKIFETSEDPSNQGISSVSEQNNDLVNVIYDLRDKIEVLQNKFHESKPRNRSRKPNRTRSTKRSSVSPKYTVNQDYCWYHNKHQHRAKKCIPPCSFVTKTKSKN